MEPVQTRKTPLREQLLVLLKDLAWHPYQDLHDVAGYRYSARLLELKRLGYRIENRYDEDGKWYRLASLIRGPAKPKKVKIYVTEEDAMLLLAGRGTPRGHEAIREALLSYREHRDDL